MSKGPTRIDGKSRRHFGDETTLPIGDKPAPAMYSPRMSTI